MSILSERTVSAFPVSIGTSLALESVSDKGGKPYDPDRKIPQMLDLNLWDQFWINISTLFRNLVGALPQVDTKRLDPEECKSALLTEMDIIEALVREESSTCQVIWYASNYTRLLTLSSKAMLRLPSTEKQKSYTKLHNSVLQLIINHRETEQRPIRVFANKIVPANRVKALILTHMPYDLVNFSKFRELDLLESHTGVLKPRSDWYTKLYDSDELVAIPFSERTLKFFGDHQLFRPFPKKARKQIIDLAKECHWLWSTTDSKVLADAKRLKDHLVRQVFTTI